MVPATGALKGGGGGLRKGLQRPRRAQTFFIPPLPMNRPPLPVKNPDMCPLGGKMPCASPQSHDASECGSSKMGTSSRPHHELDLSQFLNSPLQPEPNGWTTNPPLHVLRIPSSKSEQAHTPQRTNWHTDALVVPPTPPFPISPSKFQGLGMTLKPVLFVKPVSIGRGVDATGQNAAIVRSGTSRAQGVSGSIGFSTPAGGLHPPNKGSGVWA